MPSPRTSLRRRPFLALVILVLLLIVGYTARAVRSSDHSTPAPTSTSSAGTVALSALPVQARQTVALVQRHGPYPYAHDGIVYQNLERHLPAEPKGYYHEYTVVTPGSDDRGTRRIITGSGGQFYYTADHYASFVQVRLTG